MREKFEMLCPDCGLSEEFDPLEPFNPMKSFERKPVKELGVDTLITPVLAIWAIDCGVVCCKKCGCIAVQKVSVTIE